MFGKCFVRSAVSARTVRSSPKSVFSLFTDERLLPRRSYQSVETEDQNAARIVEAALERDGVRTICDAKIEQVIREEELRMIELEHEGEKKTWAFDQILVGWAGHPMWIKNRGFDKA